jgi:ribosomal protein S18 acetylase RimI-like enzyme
MKAILKKILIEDIPEIQKLAEKIWKTTYPTIISLEQIDFMLTEMYSKEKIIENLNQNHNWISIIYNTEVVGFSHFYEKDNLIFLSKLYILESFQNLGIGKDVFSFIIEKTKSLGLSKIQLRVNKNNLKAINAYQKYGFIIVSEDVLHLSDSFVMDDFIMEFEF